MIATQCPYCSRGRMYPGEEACGSLDCQHEARIDDVEACRQELISACDEVEAYFTPEGHDGQLAVRRLRDALFAVMGIEAAEAAE